MHELEMRDIAGLLLGHLSHNAGGQLLPDVEIEEPHGRGDEIFCGVQDGLSVLAHNGLQVWRVYLRVRRASFGNQQRALLCCM